LFEHCDESSIVHLMLVALLHLEILHHHKQLVIPWVR
jgi:hypothetical protein